MFTANAELDVGACLTTQLTAHLHQLTNSIQALLWFSFWPGPGQSMLIWIAVGYLGYWAGIEMARRQMSVADIITRKGSTEGTGLEEISNNENN